MDNTGTMPHLDAHERRRLGQSDLFISEVGLGGNTFGPPRLNREEAVHTIRSALELGVNFIDTASSYGQGESESFIGEALASSTDEVVVASKFNLRSYPEQQVDEILRDQLGASLRKLGREQVDLYQLHSYRQGLGSEELLEALAPHLEAGTIRHYGLCNFSSWRAAELCAAADRLGLPRPVSMQNYYHLLDRAPAREILPFCEQYSIGFLPYHPLAGGFLTGKYQRDVPPPPDSRGAQGSRIIEVVSTDRNWQLLDELTKLAEDFGCSLAELAIAGLLADRRVTSVIAGVSNEQQVRANVSAALVSPSADQIERLLTTVGNERSAESLPYG